MLVPYPRLFMVGFIASNGMYGWNFPPDTERRKSAICGRLESARSFAFSSIVSLAKPFSSCFLRCLVHVSFVVSFAPPFSSRFLACLISARKYRWLLDFDKCPRRTFARSPRAVPWENTLPWAVVMISQTVVPDDRGCASVCAKAVDASTSRSVGTSITAKTPNACVW